MLQLEFIRSDVASSLRDLNLHRQRRGSVRRSKQDQIGLMAHNIVLARKDMARGAFSFAAETEGEDGRVAFF